MKQIVASISARLMHDYIQDLQTDQMSMSLFKGTTQLNNVKLKPNALIQHGIPVEIVEGLIENINVDFPWMNLEKKPTIFELSNVLIVAKLKWEKLDQDMLEQEMLYNIHNTQKKQESETTGLAFLDKILNGLTVNIQNIHIRLEVPQGESFTSIGLVIPSITVNTSESNKLFITKSIQISGFYVYIDTFSEEINAKNYREQMLKTIEKGMHKQVLDIPSITTSFTHYLDNLSPVMNSFDIIIPNIFLALEHQQVIGILTIVQSQRMAHIRSQFKECKRPIDDDPEEMFMYVTRCAYKLVKKPTFDVNTAIVFLKNRKAFADLYAKQFNQKLSKSKHKSNAEAISKIEKSVSKRTKRLLTVYARRVYSKNQVSMITEAEKKEMIKESEEFRSTFSTVQVIFNIDQIQFGLEYIPQIPFLQFELKYGSGRFFLSHQDMQMGASILNFEASWFEKNNKIPLVTTITPKASAKWLVFNLASDSDDHSISIDTLPLKVHICQNFVSAMLVYASSFGEIKLPDLPALDVQVAEDTMKGLMLMKAWDININVGALDIYFEYTAFKAVHQASLVIDRTIISSAEERKDYQIHIPFNLKGIRFALDSVNLLSPLDVGVDIYTNYIDDTNIFNILANIDVINPTLNLTTPIVRQMFKMVSNIVRWFKRDDNKEMVEIIEKAKNLVTFKFEIDAAIAISNFSVSIGDERGFAITGQTVKLHGKYGEKTPLGASLGLFNLKLGTLAGTKYVALKSMKCNVKMTETTVKINGVQLQLSSMIVADFKELGKMVEGIKIPVPEIKSLADYNANVSVNNINIKWFTGDMATHFATIVIPGVTIHGGLATLAAGIYLPSMTIDTSDQEPFLTLTNLTMLAYGGKDPSVWETSSISGLAKASLEDLNFILVLRMESVGFDFRHHLIQLMLNSLSEMLPSILIPLFSFRIVLSRFTFGLPEVESFTPMRVTGIDIHFDLNNLRSIKFVTSSVDFGNVLKVAEENILSTSLIDEKICIAIPPMDIVLDPNFIGPMMQYFMLLKLKIPPFDIKVTIPEQFVDRIPNINLSIPDIAIKCLLDERLCLGLHFSLSASSSDFNHQCNFSLSDLQFINLETNRGYQKIIDNFSGEFHIRFLNGSLKYAAFFMDNDININISPIDVQNFIDLGMLWSKYVEMTPKTEPIKIITPSITLITKQITIMVCKTNRHNTKPLPIFRLIIPPIELTYTKDNNEDMYSAVIEFRMDSFNPSTGQFRTILEPVHTYLNITISEEKINIGMETEAIRLVLDTSLLKRLATMNVSTKEKSREYLEAPDFYIYSSMSSNIEVVIDGDENDIVVFPGDQVPLYQFKEEQMMMIIYLGKSISFFVKDLEYPLYFTNDVVISKHSNDGSMVIEINAPYSIKNGLIYDISIYHQVGMWRYEFYATMKPGEIKSLLPIRTKYAFMMSSIPQKVFNPAYVDPLAESFEAIVNCGNFNCNVKALFSFDRMRGVRVAELSVVATLYNCINCQMVYRIGKYQFVVDPDQSIDIPFISASETKIYICASSSEIQNFPKQSLVYLTDTNVQMINATVGNITALAVNVEPSNDGKPTKITIYPPSILFNQSSSVLVIENSKCSQSVILHPGDVKYWAPLSYFNKLGSECNLRIEGITDTQKNAFDFMGIGTDLTLLIDIPGSESKVPIHIHVQPQDGDFSFINGVTFTDAVKIRNNTKVKIVLSPTNDPQSRIEIDSDSEIIIGRINITGEYYFEVDGYPSKPRISVSTPGNYCFRILNEELNSDRNIELSVIDTRLTMIATFSDLGESTPIKIRNSLPFEFKFSQLKRNQITIAPDQTLPFAMDEPFDSQQIVVEIDNKTFLISLVEDTMPHLNLGQAVAGIIPMVDSYMENKSRIIDFRTEQRETNIVPYIFANMIIGTTNISFYDNYTREIALVSLKNIRIIIDASPDFIKFCFNLDQFSVEDQNETAKNFIVACSQNENFIDACSIFPTNVLFTKEISYISIDIQPIFVFLNTSFISDLIVFGKTIEIENLKPNKIEPPKPSEGVLSTQTINIIWAELSQIDLHISVVRDSKRKSFSPLISRMLYYVPMISDRVLSIPAYFISDYHSSVSNLINNLFADFAVMGTEKAISMLGSIGKILWLFGITGQVESMLHIVRHKFEDLSKMPDGTTSEFVNRHPIYDSFNRYTLQHLYGLLAAFGRRPSGILHSIILSEIGGIKVRRASTNCRIGISEALRKLNDQKLIERRTKPQIFTTHFVGKNKADGNRVVIDEKGINCVEKTFSLRSINAFSVGSDSISIATPHGTMVIEFENSEAVGAFINNKIKSLE